MLNQAEASVQVNKPELFRLLRYTPHPGQIAVHRIREISKMDFENASGKMVKFEASRARDGSHTGLLRVMTLPDGKLVSACPQNC